MSELNIIIHGDEVFFYQRPPRGLLKMLRRYGLDFGVRVIYCG